MEQQATRTTDGASTRELLQMEHISKSFPGVKALDAVSLTVKAGTVHAPVSYTHLDVYKRQGVVRDAKQP